jgi:hypothetical protein
VVSDASPVVVSDASTAVRGGWGGAAVGAWRVADEAGEPSFRPLPSGRLDGHLTASRGCRGSTGPGDPRQFVEDLPALLTPLPGQ